MHWYRSLRQALRRYRKSEFGTMVVGPGAGLRFDPASSNSAYASGANELPVQQVMARHLSAGATFYDVGANVGFLSVIAARLVGPSGLVYAFEPVPDNAMAIRRNATANAFQNVRVIEKALANRVGTADLALAAYSGGAVLADVASPPDRSGTIRVELTSVDALIEHEGLRPPTFVKIDVEGAEVVVLEGMEQTALRYRPTILYELDDAEPGPLRRKEADCAQWLHSHGYDVSELPPSYAEIAWLVKHFIATPIEVAGR